MRNLMMAAALFVAACAPAGDGGAALTEESAVAVVAPIYAAYLEGRIPDEAEHRAEFSNSLREREHAAVNADIPFSIYIDAQDFELSDLAIAAEAPPADGRIVVAARFRNFGQDRTVFYDLVAEQGAWRIDNVRTLQWDYRQMLAGG